MGKFAEFLKEQDNEKPYRILIVMRDVPDDPNKTGDALVKQAKKMGIDIYQMEVGGKYPMILKTAQGTQGIGVIFIDSRQSLLGTMQLVNKIDENIAMLVQVY